MCIKGEDYSMRNEGNNVDGMFGDSCDKGSRLFLGYEDDKEQEQHWLHQLQQR